MNSQIIKHFPKVTRVIDGKHPLRVEVTSTDVRNSKRKKHTECAMAVACQRMFHADGMIIGKQTAYLIKGTKAVRFSLPESVRKEIVSFDRGSGFEPGEYQLSKPVHILGSPGGRSKKKTSLGKKHHIHVTQNVRNSIAVFE